MVELGNVPRTRLGTALVVAAIAAFSSSSSCSPVGNGGAAAGDTKAAAPGSSFTIDSAQLMADVAALAADSMQGRRAGSAGGAMSRRYIVARLERLGIAPVGGGYEQAPFSLARSDSQGANVLAMIPGRTRADRYIVVSAHYDHLGVRDGKVYNGADDNASGVATLLALAAGLRRNPPEHSVLLAFFDAEEGGARGVSGARAFVLAPPVPLARIVLNVNLDMVSRSARGELYGAGTSHYPFLRPYLDSVAARAPVALRFGHDTPSPLRPTDDWTRSSDHAAFHSARIPFVYFGVEDHPDYHQPTDDVERIDPRFFAAVARTIADAVTTLDRALPAIAAAAGREP